MDATALQCLRRAWAGVRSWEETGSRAPHPFSLSLPGRGHTPRSSQHGYRVWDLQQLATTSLCPQCPVAQFPAPSAVIRFREDLAILASSPRATSVLSGQVALQMQPGVLGHLERRRLQKSQFCSAGEDVYSRQTLWGAWQVLPGRWWASNRTLCGNRDRADRQQPAEAEPRRLLSGHL